jgi:hypothetical protein
VCGVGHVVAAHAIPTSLPNRCREQEQNTDRLLIPASKPSACSETPPLAVKPSLRSVWQLFRHVPPALLPFAKATQCVGQALACVGTAWHHILALMARTRWWWREDLRCKCTKCSVTKFRRNGVVALSTDPVLRGWLHGDLDQTFAFRLHVTRV